MILTIGSGFAYQKAFRNGGWSHSTLLSISIGTCTTFIGAGLGALAAQFIGKFLLRKLILRIFKKNTKFQAIDKAIEG